MPRHRAEKMMMRPQQYQWIGNRSLLHAACEHWPPALRAMSHEEQQRFNHDLNLVWLRRYSTLKHGQRLASCSTRLDGEEVPEPDWLPCPELTSLPALPRAWNERPVASMRAAPGAASDPVHLFVLTDSRVGSTALFLLLAQSPYAGTLCSARVWMCEGDAVLQKAMALRKTQKLALSAGVLSPRRLNWSVAFDVWARYWTPSKRVRLVKSPTLAGAGAVLAETARSRGLRAAFLVLTRSPCTLNCARQSAAA